jgi:hypothetical protein
MPIPIGDRWYVPASFHAYIDDPGLPFIVQLWVQVRNSQGAWVEGILASARTPKRPDAVTSSQVRVHLKADTCLKIALEAAQQQRINLSDGTFRIPGDPENVSYGGARAVRAPGRGRAMSKDHLQAVAAVYREALATGSRKPVEVVAKQLHASRSTAGRWVGQARDEHLLGPAIGTIPGEKETRPRRKP